MAVARAVLSAISRFVSAMAMLNFGGQRTVSTSVQNLVRMTLRKRSFVCSIPPRLQVLRPPIQPNQRRAWNKGLEVGKRDGSITHGCSGYGDLKKSPDEWGLVL